MKGFADSLRLSVVLASFAATLALGVPLSPTISERGTPHANRSLRAGAGTPEIHSRSFDFRYVVDVPAPPRGGHHLRLWIPLPYQDAYQVISDLRIQAPVRYSIRSEREFHDRYAYFNLGAARIKSPFQIEFSFHVERFEHRVALHPVASAPALTPAVERFLRPDRLIPIDGAIGRLSRRQTQGVTQPLAKARKIYDYVIATMHYDHRGTGWGRGDAVWACNAKHGNCTDFHSLFIGMARAAGIPARFEIGFPLPLHAREGAIAGYHCWVEFFVTGIGWIPIDASEAWLDPSKKNYFFGAIDSNRVMFSMGRDIRLIPPPAAGPLNYFVYPYAELDGRPFPGLHRQFSFRDDAAPRPAVAQDPRTMPASR